MPMPRRWRPVAAPSSRCARIFALRSRDVLIVDRVRMVDAPGSGPARSAFLFRHQRAEIARHRAHVAVGELEPGAGEGVGELIRMLEKAPRDFLVDLGPSAATRSVVSMVGTCFFDGSCASGTSGGARPSPAIAWRPPGLLLSSHSFSNRFLKNRLLHLVGVCVQVTSRPLPVIVSAPKPVPCCALPAEALVFDARRLQAPTPIKRGVPGAVGLAERSGRRRSGLRSPRRSSPCGRTSRGCRLRRAASGSGLPFGPSGLT